MHEVPAMQCQCCPTKMHTRWVFVFLSAWGLCDRAGLPKWTMADREGLLSLHGCT